MALEEYRRRRRFAHTPEPHGDSLNDDGQWRFVVQQHAASRLHYDLRLELDGVLKSWAIPKGPSLDPAHKRLAIHVEDHPLAYLDFEAVIPVGEYGAGVVMVWDLGHWVPRGDARRDYQEGRLKFDLHGQKLGGGWMLVRLDERGKSPSNQWLWIKEKDAAARPAAEYDVLESQPRSVLSGRDMEGIARADPATTPASTPRKFTFRTSQYPHARRGKMPATVSPCLPTTTRQAPSGRQWVHEIKYDGYRMVCRLEKGVVRFYSRNGIDWSDKLPALRRAVAALPCREAWLDGEIVMLVEDGTSNFQALQHRIGAARDHELCYYVFDLLHVNGFDLRPLNLAQRKEILAELLDARSDDCRRQILLSEHLAGDGPTVFQHACQFGLEGIVSKRLDRRYREGRSGDWLKSKCLQSGEFMIGGFTRSTSLRNGLGALLLGANDDGQGLRYVGKVGTGFTATALVSLRQQLDALRTEQSPFVNLTRRAAEKGTVWVRPELIADIEFGGWTREGYLRFGSFRGLRDDLSARDVDASPALLPPAPPNAKATEPATPGAAPVEPLLLDLPPELAELRLTHPDRVVFPEPGVTKLGLAAYYAQVARWMLPHLAGRPLSLLRCPDGVGQSCFFQKRAPRGLHDSVRRVELSTREGARSFLVVDDLVGLLALVQFGVIEFHVWTTRVDRPERPDRLVFDLDPDEGFPWRRTTAAARELRDWLGAVGLASFVKTTGGRGLHVVVPIRRRHQWDEVKRFAQQVVQNFAGRSPGLYTTSPSLSARRGKIFLDSHRNTRGATTVAAYSARAKPHAPVSVPLAWEELDRLTGSDSMTLTAVLRRLSRQTADPWRELPGMQQGLTRRAWQTLAATT